MARLRFAPNVPQQLILRESHGSPILTRWGERVRYLLADGQELEVNTEVAASIEVLRLEADEPFCICMRWNGRRGQPVYWDVWRTSEAENTRAVAETEPNPNDLEHQLRQSIIRAQHGSEFSNRAPVGASESGGAPMLNPQEAILAAPASGAGSIGLKTEQITRVPPSWAQVLQDQTAVLTDVYAASIKYASAHHGNAIKSEDVRALMTTAFINLAQRGRPKVA
jgi:hypothetical protein